MQPDTARTLPAPTRPAAMPFDPHLERAAVGAVLHGTGPARDVLRILEPGDVLDTVTSGSGSVVLSQVLTAAAALLEQDLSPDPITVRLQLQAQGHRHDGPSLATLYAGVHTVGSAGHYARGVARLAWRRRAWQAAQRIAQAAESGTDQCLSDLLRDELAAVRAVQRRSHTGSRT